MKTIELPRPHGFLIWRGKQTAIATDEPLPTDEAMLIVSDGEAFGEATLGQPVQLSAKAFDSAEWRSQHCIFTEERRRFWPGATKLYVQRLIDWQPFEAVKSYIDGELVEYQPTEDERATIEKARRLPKVITLQDDALVLSGGKFVLSDGINRTQELEDILRANYNQEPEFSEIKSADELALYQLALVRNPNMIVKKNEPDQAAAGTSNSKVKVQKDDVVVAPTAVKQEGNDMPWEKVQNHEGCPDDKPWAVVKTDGGEVEGCHASEEDANAQLAALNIAEQDTNALEKEDHQDEMMPNGEALDQRLERINTQFYRAMGDDAQDLWIIHTFDDHIIVQMQGDFFRVQYAEALNQMVFDPKADWVQVDLAFQPRLKEKRNWKDKLIEAAKNIFNIEDDKEDEKFALVPYRVCVKTTTGEPWHLTWSTNAFQDRDGEIFSTKALKDFVDANEKKDKDKRGTFDFWHIPGTDFARKEWQGVIGRFLIEAGPYLDSEIGQRAKEFFGKYPDGHPVIAPEGWGASPEFRFLPEDREDGIFDTIWITKTSTLPRFAAANIWTEGKQIMTLSELTKQQEESALEVFGKEIVEGLKLQAIKRTQELEAADVAHKEAESGPEVQTEGKEAGEAQQQIEINIDELAEAVGKQFQFDTAPIAEALVTLATEIKNVSTRVEALEKTEALKSKVEIPRWRLSLTRASEAVETVVNDGDDLKEKTVGSTHLAQGESVASRLFSPK